MRKLSLLSLLFLTTLYADAQKKKIDSLKIELNKNLTDTMRLSANYELAKLYYISRPDSCIIFAQQAYLIAEKNKWPSNQADCLNNMANAYANLADYAKAMQYYFKARRIHENLNNLPRISNENDNIGATYVQEKDYKKALPYLYLALRQMDTYAASHKLVFISYAYIYINLGECYLYTHRIDSAGHYLTIGYEIAKKQNLVEAIGEYQRDLGEVQAANGRKEEALQFFRQAVKSAAPIEDGEGFSVAYLSMANLYHHYKQQDSAEFYAKKAIEVAVAGKYEQDVLNAGQVLYTYYDEDLNTAQAYKYFKITTAAKDSIYSQDKVKQLLSLDFEEKQRQQEIATAKEQYSDSVRTYSLVAGLLVLLLLAIVFWRNSRQRQKANQLLQQQKEEIEKQKKSVDQTLSELKAAQAQLIQQEKMASMGEFATGIAHEIQNPLNFVNNFSDVNIELLGELKGEIDSGNLNEVKAIADDIIENENKINHHGKRADFIVRGMLEHSRTSKGENTLTNINVLADKFFKLSYHGFQAKDNNFDAEMVADFDVNLPEIEIVQQDIGRVLLNLFNNAFYAVTEKSKTAGADYKPTIELKTFAPPSGGWGVTVRDNGNGIPDAIKDKIMQPFFTTKPTGEGTGLGLSLSYDIVVKGHGGSISVDTREGGFTEFTIYIPLT